jgi:hypothetical protein
MRDPSFHHSFEYSGMVPFGKTRDLDESGGLSGDFCNRFYEIRNFIFSKSQLNSPLSF